EADAEQTASARDTAQRIACIVERTQQWCDAFIIGRAIDRERKRTSGSQEKLHTEALFEPLDALRYRRRRCPGEPRRCAEGSRLYCADKGIEPSGGFDSYRHLIVFGKKFVPMSTLIFQKRKTKSISVFNKQGGL